VRLYDLLSATPTRPLLEIDDFDWHVHGIKIAPNGSVFAVDGLRDDHGNRRRIFKLYECQSGRQLGSLPTGLNLNRGAWFFFDWSSKVLAVQLVDGDDTATLISLPDLGYRGVAKAPVACLSLGAKWSMSSTSDQPPAMVLYDLGTGMPHLRVVQDVQARHLDFSPDDRHAIAARKDGTVSVLDLVEINKQLTKLDLGW
jgi:hypothetical protein